MNSKIDAKILHDKATRGIALTEEEQTVLTAWYAREDEAEARIIHVQGGKESLASLQAQVNAALAQLAISVQRIQETASENERIRREIAELRSQLVDTALAQTT